jgi:hypothetical protein
LAVFYIGALAAAAHNITDSLVKRQVVALAVVVVQQYHMVNLVDHLHHTVLAA